MTRQNFGLVLFSKMLPGNKTFPFFVKFYLLWFWIFASSGKNLQKYYWTWILSLKKQFLISGFKFQDLSPQSFILLKWFLLHLEPVLHCNLLANAFKISTKIWGCHVMVPHHFYAKIPSGHWRFWVLHQLFQSGPVGTFALQPI